MENVLLLIFDILNFGLLVFVWRFTIKNYTALPDTIPVHFDFDGKADRFGNRKYFYLMPAVLTVLYFAFAIIVRIPESANYPVPVTAENEDAQFLIMKIFIRWIFLLVTLLFFNSQDYMFRYSFNETAKPRVPFSAMLFSIIGSMIVLFIFIGVFK